MTIKSFLKGNLFVGIILVGYPDPVFYVHSVSLLVVVPIIFE